jgi:hypothetical protein
MVTLILASTARINWCHVTALCLDPFFNFVPLDFRQEPLPDFGRVLDVDPHADVNVGRALGLAGRLGVVNAKIRFVFEILGRYPLLPPEPLVKTLWSTEDPKVIVD